MELRREQRQDARPARRMICPTASRAWRLAVGPRLERRVRPHWWSRGVCTLVVSHGCNPVSADDGAAAVTSAARRQRVANDLLGEVQCCQLPCAGLLAKVQRMRLLTEATEDNDGSHDGLKLRLTLRVIDPWFVAALAVFGGRLLALNCGRADLA